MDEIRKQIILAIVSSDPIVRACWEWTEPLMALGIPPEVPREALASKTMAVGRPLTVEEIDAVLVQVCEGYRPMEDSKPW